jgi:hypothetical protein
MHKRTARSPNAESVTIIANPIEQDLLKQIAERLATFPISMELADGSVYRTTGIIDYPGTETEENRADITIMPDRSKDAWQLFAAA